MKHLQITTALVLGAALAANDALGADPGDGLASAESSESIGSGTDSGCSRRAASGFMSESTVSVQRLLGMRVTNPINEEIGEVADLIVDQCGRIKSLVVHVGGIWEFGGHYVRISLHKVWIRSPDNDSGGLVMMVRETRDNMLRDDGAISRTGNGSSLENIESVNSGD